MCLNLCGDHTIIFIFILCHVVGATWGSMPLLNGPGWRRKMEWPPRLGLGTISIAPFVKGLIYYQSMCPEFRYGDGKVLGTQPHSTCRLASIHCVLRLNLIKDIFNTRILESHTH